MASLDEEDIPADDFSDADKAGSRYVPDFVRRLAWAGLGAVFMSEEGIRRLSRQLKLPKEALSYLLQQADKTKDDFGRVVSEEVRKLLQSDRLRDELLKMIGGMTIEIRAEVKLVPDRVKGETPSILPRVTVSELKTNYSGDRRAQKDDVPEDS
jgi:hypothetical protein